VNDVDVIGVLSGHKEVLMTRLRKMMLEELERRNYSEATTRCYIRTVEDFSRRFKRSPDCLGPEHIREYQAELFKKRKLSPGTVTQRLAALRFLYIKTLRNTWSIAETPYPKRAFHLPAILSREEVERLIDADWRWLHGVTTILSLTAHSLIVFRSGTRYAGEADCGPDVQSVYLFSKELDPAQTDVKPTAGVLHVRVPKKSPVTPS
jgi:integrase